MFVEQPLASPGSAKNMISAYGWDCQEAQGCSAHRGREEEEEEEVWGGTKGDEEEEEDEGYLLQAEKQEEEGETDYSRHLSRVWGGSCQEELHLQGGETHEHFTHLTV